VEEAGSPSGRRAGWRRSRRCQVEEAASLPGVEVGSPPGRRAGWGRSRRCRVEDVASLPGVARERTWQAECSAGQELATPSAVWGYLGWTHMSACAASRDDGVRGALCKRNGWIKHVFAASELQL
jgi:hypothetical protein